MSNFEFLKGNIEIIILNSLYSADRYGYEITKEIKEKTENTYEIKQPTLYSYLKRLESYGLIRSYWGEESSGGRRKYYAITELGREQCDAFTAEWKYQKSVLDTLVTDSDEVTPTPQEDATPLFGSKTKKKRARKMLTLAEQENISSRLLGLSENDDGEQNDTEVNENVDESIATRKEKEQPKEIHIDVEANDTDDVQDEQYYQPSHDIEGFFDRFNKKAQEIIDKRSVEPETQIPMQPPIANDDSTNDASEGEIQREDNAYGAGNYKHVLGSVFKNQFEDDALHVAPTEIAQTEAPTAPQTLDKLSDLFALQGVRLRQYNRESSAYVPRTMLSKNKLMCVAMWLTFFSFVCEAVLVWLLARPALSILTPSIFVIGALLVPIVFSVLYLINPSKKVAPEFDFKYHFVNTLITAGLVIVLAFSLFVLFAQKFSDLTAVMTWIVLPIIVGINAPTYVLYYKLLYKKMLV